MIADGTVTLSEDDIAALSTEEAGETETKPQTSRRIVNNEVSRYSLQVNTPIGVDVWEGIGSVTIEGNKAIDHSIQWNYPIASVDAFLAALQIGKAET